MQKAFSSRGGNRRRGDIKYIFKHALTQELAYNSLLSARRKLLHEHAAMAAESLFATSLAHNYDDLAHHYGRSGKGAEGGELPASPRSGR